MQTKLDLLGQQFGRLVVIGGSRRSKSGVILLRCKCACGNITYVSSSSLRSGHTKSCGCWKKECAVRQGRASATHGASHSRLWNVYRGMCSRCYNPNVEQYKNYGAKGVTVCDEWKGHFEAFRDWAVAHGYDPNAPFGECTLDRIDNTKEYSPTNCRWVDMKTQVRNRRITKVLTVDGITKPLAEWAEITNQKYDTLKYRKNAGWSDKEVVYGRRL